MRKLATGGMAEVYVAKAEGPGGFEKTLVVKRILPQFAERQMFVRMFLAEAKIAAQLDHPNIVQIFDFGEADGSYYLAMEFVDGPNLRSLIRWALATREPLPLSLVARIMALACEGLAYAHEFANPETGEPLRLIHRDVSTENVMVARTGAVKVLDFGIAKVAGDEHKTRAGGLKGKVGYMPPEQVKGMTLDLRIDIYALGVVLYQLLCGKKPYEQPNDVSLIAAILQSAPTPILERRPDLPSEMAAIVGRAMARDRDARYPGCRQMQEALEAFILKRAEPAGSVQLSQLVARFNASGFARGQAGSTSSGATSRPGSRSATGTSSQVSPLGTPPPPSDTPSDTEVAKVPGPTTVVAAVPGPSPEEKTFAPPPEGENEPTSPGDEGPQVAAPRPAEFASAPPAAMAAIELSPADVEPEGGLVAANADQISWQGQSTEALSPSDVPVAAEEGVPDEQDFVLDRSPAAGWTHYSPDQAAGVPAPALAPEPQAVINALPPAPAAPAVPAALPRSTPETMSQARPVGVEPPQARPVAPQRPLPASGPGLVEAIGPARQLGYVPTAVAPEPIQMVVRATATTDRSINLVRKFPVVAARILESAREVPASLQESLAGVVDALLLAEDHASLRKLVDRAGPRPGEGQSRFGALLLADLSSPLRIAWLVERLRGGLPAAAGSLRDWLKRVNGSLLMWAIDSVEAGPAQDLLCDALAPQVAANPVPIFERLDDKATKNHAVLCYLLERAQVKERAKVFQKLQARRDPMLQMQLMSGRARAGGPEAINLLAGAICDPNNDIRRHALKLLADVEDVRVQSVLSAQLQQPNFETRPAAERAALWTALGASGRDASLPLFEQVFSQKTTLLNKKKSLDAKLPALEGLGAMKSEGAGKLLNQLAADRVQPDEVVQASKAALARRAAGAGAERTDLKAAAERRIHQGRSVCLDLLYLARAANAVDLGGGMLDAALERFREEVRQVVLTEGKLQVVASEKGLLVNNVVMNFGNPGEDVGVTAARWLQAYDFRGMVIESPLPAAELRSFLLRMFDPDGESERAPHIRVATFSGRSLAPAVEPAPPADPTARVRELFLSAVALLRREREAARLNRPAAVADARALLDELSRIYSAGTARFLGLAPERQGELSFAVHACNTALSAMAFAADLGLGRAHVYELGEVALFSTLGEVALPPDRRPAPGEPPPEEVRLRNAWLFLTQLRSRRGPAYAVTSLEAGLDASRMPGMLASILALAEAWDALTVQAKVPAEKAVEVMKGKLRPRFNPDLLGMFSTWARAQAAAPAPN